jgi:hypothetical protein
MAAIIGIVLLGAVVSGMAYLVVASVNRRSAPAWKRDAAYKERPVDQYVTVSMS